MPVAGDAMNQQEKPTFLRPLSERLHAIERVITRPVNTITFLVIRFVLMSGMVVGFSWWALNIAP